MLHRLGEEIKISKEKQNVPASSTWSPIIVQNSHDVSP